MTTRDVQPGEELRVWYALYYGLKLQALPLAEDSLHEVTHIYTVTYFHSIILFSWLLTMKYVL